MKQQPTNHSAAVLSVIHVQPSRVLYSLFIVCAIDIATAYCRRKDHPCVSLCGIRRVQERRSLDGGEGYCRDAYCLHCMPVLGVLPLGPLSLLPGTVHEARSSSIGITFHLHAQP